MRKSNLDAVGGWIGTPAPESDLDVAVQRGIADMEKLAL